MQILMNKLNNRMNRPPQNTPPIWPVANMSARRLPVEKVRAKVQRALAFERSDHPPDEAASSLS